VLTEALPLAAAGALYPVAFAAIVAILGGRDPMRRALVFLLGGAVVSLIGYAVIITVVRTLDFTPGGHPKVAASIKLLLGVALLIYAGLTWIRRHKASTVEVLERNLEHEAATAHAESAPVEEVAEPPLRRALISGMLIYFPGVFLVASADSIAEADATLGATLLAAILCTIALLLIVEVPIAAFAVAPDRVGPPLERITTLGKIYSKQLILAAALVAGIYLVIAGLVALT
jgi:hypothetical protein